VTKSAAKLDKEFKLQGIKFTDSKEEGVTAAPKFPESFKQTSDRCLRIIDYHNNCVKTDHDGKMTAYIGLSHGFAIYQLAQQVGKTGKAHKTFEECDGCFKQKAWVKKNCNYSSMTAWKVTEAGKGVETKMFINSSDKHVKSKAP